MKARYQNQSRQIRAARALLDWSQGDLARSAKISVATIRKLELGYISPRAATMQLVCEALEASGLEFIEPGGIRRRHDEVTIYQGYDGIVDFFDDIYQTAKKKGGEIVAVCKSESALLPPMESETTAHIERMSHLKAKVSVKCILMQEAGQLRGTAYSEYRLSAEDYVDSVPFLVYDNKYVVAHFGKEAAPKIMVIQSGIACQAFRLQFKSMWEKATPLIQEEKKQ